MTVEPLLAIRDVRKHFGALKALDGVTLDIVKGEIHCLLGENGAGKSTLCNIIFGVYQPDAGTMSISGAAHRPSGPKEALEQGVAMVHQHFSLVSDMTVVDNLLLGQARGILRRKECAERVLDLSRQYGLDLEPFARVQDLSVGERQRVEIVKCLMRQPRLLVLDEPTAVLLPDEIDGLLSVCQRVASEGCSVVLVTHKLAEVRRAAHRVSVLRAGQLVASSDQPARDISILVRAMIQRDLAQTDAAAAGMLGLPEDVDADATIQQTVLELPPQPVLLSVESLCMRDAQGGLRLDNISLQVYRQEIVGIAGVEGNGQSELGAILSGMAAPLSGRFLVNGHRLDGAPPARITAQGVGIVPEDRHQVACISDMSLAENLCLSRLDQFRRFGRLDRTAMRRHSQERMSAFDVRASGADAPFSSLSGGNQQKAVLAREFAIPGLCLLVAAQPTRGLDVGAVEAIYGHIRSAARSGIGVLLISSELDELIQVAHRILVMFRGRVMGECDAHPANRARIGAWMAGHTI